MRSLSTSKTKEHLRKEDFLSLTWIRPTSCLVESFTKTKMKKMILISNQLQPRLSISKTKMKVLKECILNIKITAQLLRPFITFLNRMLIKAKPMMLMKFQMLSERNMDSLKRWDNMK